MVAHVLARLAPQVGAHRRSTPIRISIAYAAFGHPVVPDAVGGFAGPLAGLHAGHDASRHRLCGDGAVRFAVPAARSGRARLAVGPERANARSSPSRARSTQPHPVFALVERSVAAAPRRRSCASGGRKIDAWYATLRWSPCRFDDEEPARFATSTRATSCATATPRRTADA